MDLRYILIIICVLFLISLCMGMAKKGMDMQKANNKKISSKRRTPEPPEPRPSKSDSSTKLNKRFYEVDETYPELNRIYTNLDEIKKEISGLTAQDEIWNDWPERALYATENKEWKIIPFKAFDMTVEKNCQRFPNLWRFISSIPNVRVAIISKLTPGMKLNPHQGWGAHSNHVLRCHFGLNVPVKDACYISVADEFDKIKNEPIDEEKQYHAQDRWIVFDDSKHHYAENPTDLDRVVLIMDIDRPEHVETGTSKIKDTKELMEIVNSFRQKREDN
jgi:aspartyl/asparaginyl beta-hydroxylase (cupin superfamily)